MNNQISIIIPVLNEARNIGKLLQYIELNSSKGNIAEIIVVDGGSSDGSIDITTNYIESSKQNIILLSSKKGRSKQMNLGVKNSTGNILYFLHADSFPPTDFDKHIINEITKNNLAGCFRLQFDNNHWWLRLASWLTQFHWRACRGGDQSQFITKELFTELGGFDEKFIIYEDNDLINKLYTKKEFIVINEKIKTSARLYERIGVWTLQYYFWTIYVKKWLGASPEELYQYYLKNIKE